MPAHFQSRLIMGGVGLLLLAGIIYYFTGASILSNSKTPTPVSCPADAKQCPDGGYVGRIGSKCEFATCPTPGSVPVPAPNPQSMDVNAHFTETVKAGNFSITPKKLLEDSRCPSGVQCIQAGTVRVEVLVGSELGNYPLTLTLGVPVSSGAGRITLIGAYPAKTKEVTIQNSEYLFTFHVTSK